MFRAILGIVLLTLHILAGNYWMNGYNKSRIAKIHPISGNEKHHKHSTREACSEVPNRLYIVYGGSGFIGSWIARYLLLRGETVVIIDKHHPPADLARNDVKFYHNPMDDDKLMDLCVSDVLEAHWHNNADIIVYNSCCERQYPQVRHHSKYDPGLRATEVLLYTLQPRADYAKFTIINIGDTMCERTPIHWMRWWDRRNWIQVSPDDAGIKDRNYGKASTNEVATIYGWYQGSIEQATFKSVFVSAGIRSEGVVVGHLGDNQLARAIFNGYGLLHNWGVPMNFIHVEDLVRAALSLEYQLLAPETRQEYNGLIFSVSGARVTTLEHVYDYIKTKRKFKTIPIHPIVVWALGYLISFLTMIFSNENYAANANLFTGTPNSLTLARFFTVQGGHRRNHKNVQRTQEMLKFKPNYTDMGAIVDEIIEEVEVLEKKLQKEKAT